ncbi:MAG TPA: carbohydrate-binding protein [Tepidisphaeraceae bacterium]|jgi:uncharacterized delta-60 repeat protein|nr:carbohydrate-binding protein [Tepidisphaeraceae bacterium]
MRAHKHQHRNNSASARLAKCIEQLEARTLLSASDLDTTFGAGGFAPTLANAQFNATVVQTDGKIIAVGNTTTGDRDMIVARYNVNGTLDTTFSGDGLAYVDLRDDDYATAVALTPQGKIVVGGFTTSTFDVGTDFAIVRLNANGTLDTSFSDDGKRTWHVGTINDHVADIALQADGKVLLVGSVTPSVTIRQTDPDYGTVVGRLTVSGATDTTFAGGTGYYRTTAADGLPGRAIGILPTGKIVVGSGSGGSGFNVFALNSNGTRATDVFTQSSYLFADGKGGSLNDLVVLPNGDVALSGDATRSNESFDRVTNLGLMLLDPTGDLKASRMVETSYNTGTGWRATGAAIAYANGRLTVTGSSGYSSSYVSRYLATDLSPDTTFAPENSGTPYGASLRFYYHPFETAYTFGIANDPSGHIVVAGGAVDFRNNMSFPGTILYRLDGDPVDDSGTPVTLQAESAWLTGGTVAASQHGGYNGTGYADFAGGGSGAAFTVNRNAGGMTQLAIRYANGGMTNRPMNISINGRNVTLQFAPTGGWNNWATVTTDSYLLAGGNDIRIVATTGDGGPNVDQMTVTPLVPTARIEAESASPFGGTIVTSEHAGYTGSGYADFGNRESGVNFTVNVPTDGPHVLDFRYSHGGADDRTTDVIVNGVNIGEYFFPNTPSWSEWSNVQIGVRLSSGVNTIRLVVRRFDGPNLDSLTVRSGFLQMPAANPPVDAALQQLRSGTTIGKEHAGFTGIGYADFGGKDSIAELFVRRDTLGPVALEFRYANGSGADRPVDLYSEGYRVSTIAFPSTGSWTNWRTVTVHLPQWPTLGYDSVVLRALDAGGPNLDSLLVTGVTTYQAENATRNDVAVDTKHPGYTGAGYADFGGTGAYVQMQIEGEFAGPTTVQLRYANGDTASRPLSVSVNNVVAYTNVAMPSTGSWNNWNVVTLTLDLKAGSNLLRLTSTTDAGVNLDSVIVG